jgi:hypothetical protein
MTANRGEPNDMTDPKQLPSGWTVRREADHVQYISPCETVLIFDSYGPGCTPYGAVYERLALVDAALRKSRC